MKHERLHETELKRWANDMRDIIAASLVVTKNAANADDNKTITYTVMDLLKSAFAAGWDAAIGWCMQPEEEVPARTAIPSEHNNENTFDQIISDQEGEVNG